MVKSYAIWRDKAESSQTLCGSVQENLKPVSSVVTNKVAPSADVASFVAHIRYLKGYFFAYLIGA